ncbi:hypothetical protein GCM10027019_07470 [Melaminivora jejuensis]
MFVFLFGVNFSCYAAIVEMYPSMPPDGFCKKKVEVDHRDVIREGMIYNTLRVKGQDKYISESKSKIMIWESREGILNGCRNASDWRKISDIVPVDQKVVTFGSNSCDLGNFSKDAGDVVYIAFRESLGVIKKSGKEKAVRYFYKIEDWYKKPAVRSKKEFDNYYVDGYGVVDFSAPCLVIK